MTERCPTCGIECPSATACNGYCAPACWPETRREREAAAEDAPRRKRSKSPSRSQRFATLNAFVDFGIAAAELTPAETIAWLVLFRDTKRDGTARTGQADIARRGRLSVRGVRKAIQSLAAKGMLMVTRRGRLNDGPSTYRLYATPRDE